MEYNFLVSLTEDEFADFNDYTLWLAPWNKKKKTIFFFKSLVYSIILMIGITYLIDEITTFKQKNDINIRLELSLFFGLISVWYNYTHVSLRIRKRAKQKLQDEENRNFIKETELKISDTGIYGTNKTGTSSHSWISLVKYAVTKNYFYLYISSIQAIIIPKRLFISQKEISEFDNFITEKIPLASSFRSMEI